MERYINHYDVASDPPEITDKADIERCYQGSALEILEREFTEDPEALATNVLILLNLAARASQLIDCHGEDVEQLLGESSQTVYIELLEQLSQAGSESLFEPGPGTLFTSIFEKIERAAVKREPWSDLDMPCDEFRTKLNNDIKQALRLEEALQRRDGLPDKLSRRHLSQIRELLLEVTEDHFINLTRNMADHVIPISTSGFDLELLEKFCEPLYWKKAEERLQVEQEIGDQRQRHITQRIGHSYLKWVGAQYKYVAHVRTQPYSMTGHNNS